MKFIEKILQVATHVAIGKNNVHKTIKRYRCFLRFIPEKLLMDRKRNANASLCSTLPLLKQYFSEKGCTNVVYENTKNNKTCLVLKKQRCVCSAAKEISNHTSVSWAKTGKNNVKPSALNLRIASGL